MWTRIYIAEQMMSINLSGVTISPLGLYTNPKVPIFVHVINDTFITFFTYCDNDCEILQYISFYLINSSFLHLLHSVMMFVEFYSVLEEYVCC